MGATQLCGLGGPARTHRPDVPTHGWREGPRLRRVDWLGAPTDGSDRGRGASWRRNRHVVRNLSMVLIGVFGVWGLLAPEAMTGPASGVMGRVLGSAGWMYLCTGFLVLGAYLTLGRHGSVRLGADDARPEFPTPSWLTMLFAAGVGSGLVFWGVAEPVSHFAHPPADTLPSSAAPARLAMVLANLHWGLHIWAIYAVCGLVIGYFSFRRGLPVLISTPIRATLPRRCRTSHTPSRVRRKFSSRFGCAGARSY